MSATTTLTQRPMTEADMPFLFRIYASTREWELSHVPWTDEQKHAFVTMQFNAQHVDYQRNYPDAAFNIVEDEQGPVGRLYLHRREKAHHILDITIAPERRSAGIGTRLLTEVINEASAEGKPVSIHVEKFNPAQRLYQRLGFVQVEDGQVYLLMERPPNASDAEN